MIMRKYILFIALLFTILLTACEDQQENNSKKAQGKEQEKDVTLNDKYSITSLKIGRGKQTIKGLKAYQDFDDEVIQYILNKYNLKIIYITLPNMEDAQIALNTKRIDVIPSVTENSDDKMETTYSYQNEPFYFPNGWEFSSSSTFRYGVRKDDTNLLNFLNDAIQEMDENGVLETFYAKHIGERAALEHIKLKEVTSYGHMEKLNRSERQEILETLKDFNTKVDIEKKN